VDPARHRGSFRALALGAAAAAGALACAGEPIAPPGPPAQVAGSWIAIGELSDGGSLLCYDTARAVLVQDGERLDARVYHAGHCPTPSGPGFELSFWQEDSTARVRGRTIRYRGTGCASTGTVSADGSTIEGRLECSQVPLNPVGFVGLSGPWRMHRGDFSAPHVVDLTVTPAAATHGDTVTVAITARDSVALAWVAIGLEFPASFGRDCGGVAPPTLRDTIAVAGPEATATFRVPVVTCAVGTYRLRYAAGDTAGNVAERQSEVYEFRAAESVVAGAVTDTVLTGGDTARIVVQATNARGLSWIGVRAIDGVSWADSVAATGTAAQHEFRRVTPEVAGSGGFGVIPFARHSLGHLTEAPFASTRLTDALILPARMVTLPRAPGEHVVDIAGGTLLLTDPVDPVLRVLREADFETPGTIALPRAGVSVELGTGSDSLLVTHRSPGALSVLDRGSATWRTVSLTLPVDLEQFHTTEEPRQVRAMATGRVLLALASGTGGHVFEVNTVSGALVTRSGWFSGTAFHRTADRSRAYVDAWAGLIYDSAADAFVAAASLGLSQLPGPTLFDVDAAVSMVLAGCRGYTPALAPALTVDERAYSSYGVAISPDGTRIYCGRPDGVDEFDAVTGAWRRAFWTTSAPTWIRMLGDGHLVVGLGTRVELLTLP
jgi:hypothetical protein